jgi:adenylate cyclase
MQPSGPPPERPVSVVSLDAAPGSRRRTVTMRFTLLALILSLLVVSGMAINGVWFFKSRETRQDASDRFFALFANVATSRINDLLRPAAFVLRDYHIRAQRGLLAVNDTESLGDVLVERLRANPGFYQLYHADTATGRFVGAFQPVDETVILRRSQPDVNGGAFVEWRVDPDGSHVPHRSDIPAGYDARQRPWYALAVAQPNDELVWTEPYQFAENVPGITAAMAWRLPGEAQARGVFAISFSLRDIADFMTESARLGDTRDFLVTRQGQIVASSSPRPGDPDDAVWRAVHDALPHPLDTLSVDTPVNVAVAHAGVAYLGVVQVVHIIGGLEWAVVSVVPEARFLAASIANTRTAAVVGLMVLLVAIGLGWLVSGRVGRPLRRIAADLEQVGHFNLSREPAPTSLIQEISVISDVVDRMKTSLRSFSHYVPVDLVRDVIASGNEARLGGEIRELTIFFSDIAGFTTISERIAPEALVPQLAEYLEAVTGAVRAEGGTIDKYIGDGIVAFFNAPRFLPTHAAASCRAALAAQAALRVLEARWAAAGQPAFPTRIGLNTGEVLVGNIGTPERFAYTAIGDAMNLAGRLESLNKTYGTKLLASEVVRTTAESGFEWRRLDRVAVVGRQQGTLLFELLGEVGSLPHNLLAARDCYDAALDAYFGGRFAEAAAGFAEAGQLRPRDLAADIMAERARTLAQHPPGPGWNGVFISRQK